jgi:peptide/nickel transport system substrate-binding protein
LLLEAGWYDRDGDGLRDKNGQPFRFELLLPSGAENPRRRAALMKENLRKMGIDMTIRELEWATFIESINDRKFDAVNLGWAGEAEEDPYQLWHTSQSENRGSNMVGFGTAETDRMIESMRLMIDDHERHEAMFGFHRILHAQQPYLFLFASPNLGLYDKRYRGVKFYPIRPGYDLTEWFLPEGSDGM